MLNKRYFLIQIVFFCLVLFQFKSLFQTSTLIRHGLIKKPLPTIFCIIFTAPGKFQENKPGTVLSVWASKCDEYRFITKISDKTKFKETKIKGKLVGAPMNILQPNGWLLEDYHNLTTKVLLSFRDVFLEFPNYDWYLKADDDTFIEVDNLREFLSQKNSKMPITFGYDFKLIVEKGYHSGKFIYRFGLGM